jgi:hypothetical protein
MTTKQINTKLKENGYNVYLEIDKYSKEPKFYLNTFQDGEFIETNQDDIYTKDFLNAKLNFGKGKIKDVQHLNYFK